MGTIGNHEIPGGSNPPNKSRAADVARQRARDKAALDAFARWIILDCGDPAPKFKNWQEMLEWIRKNFVDKEMR